MPSYDYACPSCRKPFTVFRAMKHYRDPAYCPDCSTEGNRVISAPAVVGDFAGYECPVSGAWIEGRRAHEENLKRTGCRVYEPGETEAFKQRKAQQEAAFDTLIEDSVGEAIAQLPAEKKLALAQEFEQGVDATVVR